MVKKNKGIIYGLKSFYSGLKSYQARMEQLNSNQTILGHWIRERDRIREKLVRETGVFKKIVIELTEKQYFTLNMKTYDIWNEAFNPSSELPTQSNLAAIAFCINAVNEAIGKLESDIEAGVRDEQGNLIKIAEKSTNITEKPKAFIAHGGETRARNKLQRFLTSLGVQPLIIEEEPKEGRSVNQQVEHYINQADCAIILGTADDKELKDGKLYPRRNVYIEIGRFQEKFPNRIIYLLEDGGSFPSNISEKLYTSFTHESMDEAFISVVRELTKFGILKAVKPQEKEQNF